MSSIQSRHVSQSVYTPSTDIFTLSEIPCTQIVKGAIHNLRTIVDDILRKAKIDINWL